MTDPRLPRLAVPSAYRLELAPSLSAHTFTGTAEIDVEILKPTSHLVLNSIELTIHSASVVINGTTHTAVTTLDDETERLTLTLDGEVAAGPATVQVAFDGILNDQLHGFYRSTYTADDGTEHTIATTQFQSTDARRCFPCWDEPEYKATFETTLIVDADHLAVTNTSEVAETTLDDGRRRIQYAPTMVMSTYLVAFVVGPLEATESIHAGGVPIRVVHRPGQGDRTSFALDVAAAALDWFADYYAIPYPSDKVDLIAIPDFAFGAMENLGCVTFREVLLIIDPADASQPELQRAADVISHELAHMWFGDLVTMQWWEGIWLNEAFATFMETSCSDAYRPDWRVWDTFARARSAAFDVDALASTRPIEFPVVTPQDAEGMFDLLTYEKGASVVRMLEQYLGAEVFRDGVRHYLDTHS
ncbi:MAG TPA: peptidase, partial [Acidimicrobiaceae bacterium]|nr:peptidase [Acidimicrobiaceae bacterium]